MSWTLATIAILPLVYIGSREIGDFKTRLMVTKILSIIYGFISISTFALGIVVGLDNGTIWIVLKNLMEAIPVIFGFLVLSIFIYRKVKYEK